MEYVMLQVRKHEFSYGEQKLLRIIIQAAITLNLIFHLIFKF